VPFCYYKLLSPLLQAMDLLELLVCGSIVSLDIPLRVVQHELWRNHILESNGDDYESDTETEVTHLLEVLEHVAVLLSNASGNNCDVRSVTRSHAYDAYTPWLHAHCTVLCSVQL
jgi:hypothetical protein